MERSEAIRQRSGSVGQKPWLSSITLAFVAVAAIALILTGCQPEPSESSDNRGEVALDSSGSDTSFVVPGPAEPEAIQVSQLHSTPTRIPPATPLPPAPAPTAEPMEIQTPTVAPGPPRSIDDVYILQPGDIVSSIHIVNPHEEIDAGGFRARSNPDMAVSPDGRFVYILDSWLTEVIRGEVRHELIKFDALTKELIWAAQIDANRTPYRSYPHRREVMVSSQGNAVFTAIIGVSGEPPSRTLDSRLIAFDSDTGEITGELSGLQCGWEWLPISESQMAALCDQRVTIFDVESGQRNELLPFAVPATQEAADVLSLSDVVISSQPPRIIGVTRNGEVIATSALDQPIVSVSKIVQLPDGWHFTISTNALTASSDGKLYAGVAEEEGENWADEIWVYDMSSGERTGRIALERGLLDMELSQDGALLYVMEHHSSLSIIDTRSLATVATITGVGPGVIRTR